MFLEKFWFFYGFIPSCWSNIVNTSILYGFIPPRCSNIVNTSISSEPRRCTRFGWTMIKYYKASVYGLKRVAKINGYHSPTAVRWKYKSRYSLVSRHWDLRSDAIKDPPPWMARNHLLVKICIESTAFSDQN